MEPVVRTELTPAPPPRRSRTGRVVLVVLIAVIVAALVVVAVVSSQPGRPKGQGTPAASPSLSSPPVLALSPVQPTQAVANCQAEPATETLQQLTIPARSTEQVVLSIDSTTAPGSNGASRDALLLSEVAFAAAG